MRNSQILLTILICCLLTSCSVIGGDHTSVSNNNLQNDTEDVTSSSIPIPTQTASAVPIQTIKERMSNNPFLTINNDTIDQLNQNGDEIAVDIYEKVQLAISENVAWNNKFNNYTIDDFSISIFLINVNENEYEVQLYGTKDELSFILGVINKDGRLIPINYPVVEETGKNTNRLFYIDREDNQIDILSTVIENGTLHYLVNLSDGKEIKYSEEDFTEDYEKTIAASLLIEPISILEYEVVNIISTEIVVKDAAHLVRETININTGEKSFFIDGMIDEEREIYRNKYEISVSDGKLITSDLQVITDDDLQTDVLKHIYALMDKMPALPENQINLEWNYSGDTKYLEPVELPGLENLPYDIINGFIVDDDNSSCNGEDWGLLFLRVHNKDDSYGVLPLMVCNISIQEIVDAGGMMYMSSVVDSVNLKDFSEHMKEVENNPDSVLAPYRYLGNNYHYYDQLQELMQKYQEQGIVDRGLANIPTQVIKYIMLE